MKQNGMTNIDVAILRDELAGTGCSVEVTRCCVWISGNTYPIRGALKKAGWKYSGKRRAWWKPTDAGAAYTVGGADAVADARISPDAVNGYALAGIRDGRPVIVAECQRMDARAAFNPWDDLDYALGY